MDSSTEKPQTAKYAMREFKRFGGAAGEARK
jgi:hypothetical protein